MKYLDLTEVAPSMEMILLQRLKQRCLQHSVPHALVALQVKRFWQGFFCTKHVTGKAQIEFFHDTLEITIDYCDNFKDQVREVATELGLSSTDQSLLSDSTKGLHPTPNHSFNRHIKYTHPILANIKPWCMLIGQIINLNDSRPLKTAVAILNDGHYQQTVTEAAPSLSQVLLTRIKNAINQPIPMVPALTRLELVTNQADNFFAVRCAVVEPNTDLWFEPPNRMTLMYNGSIQPDVNLQQIIKSLNLSADQTQQFLEKTPPDDNHWNGWERHQGGHLEYHTKTDDPIFSNLKPFSTWLCQLCQTKDFKVIDQAVYQIQQAARLQHSR
jgi:hypothetical protein